MVWLRSSWNDFIARLEEGSHVTWSQ